MTTRQFGNVGTPAAPLTGAEKLSVVQGGALVDTTAQAIADLGSGGGTAATNLSFTRDATTVTVQSDTGTDAVLPGATSANAGVMLAADKAKLDRAVPALPVVAASIVGGVVTLDLSAARHFTLALTANATLAFSNVPGAGFAAEFALRVLNSGGFTLTLPASMKAVGGSDTAVASGAGAYTLLTAASFDQGTRWAYAMQDIAA